MAKHTTADSVTRIVQDAARRLPDVEEGVACEGTVLESRTFKTRRKAFLFLSQKAGNIQLRLKLDGSRPEATRLAAKQPEVFSVGSLGWVGVVFAPTDAPSVEVLRRWIGESHALMAGPPSKGAAKKIPKKKRAAARR